MTLKTLIVSNLKTIFLRRRKKIEAIFVSWEGVDDIFDHYRRLNPTGISALVETPPLFWQSFGGS